jgi:hypothetical protein
VATRPKQWPQHAEATREQTIGMASDTIETLEEALKTLDMAQRMMDNNNRPTAREMLANVRAFIALAQTNQSHIWRLMVEAKHPERSDQ